jgi:hypothetical protein
VVVIHALYANSYALLNSTVNQFNNKDDGLELSNHEKSKLLFSTLSSSNNPNFLSFSNTKTSFFHVTTFSKLHDTTLPFF